MQLVNVTVAAYANCV